ncbi:rho GTPase-activating protein REN1-like [Panicum miliaceum]|uniref:Rho GTPase-activating protein REN1-like n=1 Tax=Panicum miliaceum TaxID=4540 RepID=A0A3L6TG29_PANMI|nr:rho GTPase-activating protein REN1-like [Panicum miliaceum]
MRVVLVPLFLTPAATVTGAVKPLHIFTEEGPGLVRVAHGFLWDSSVRWRCVDPGRPIELPVVQIRPGKAFLTKHGRALIMLIIGRVARTFVMRSCEDPRLIITQRDHTQILVQRQVSSSQPNENISQVKACRCGAGDSNFQNTNKSEASENSPTTCPNCQVLKSGNLLLSSKGIGWTVWKKRWFILTRTSLVFFRSDPNAPPPRGSEPIVTLGGIDLNNTASMIVKEERKTITVVFPDGRDGRTFTLKAETTEDLNEWRSALESALAQAPSVVNTAGQHPIVSTDIAEPAETAAEQSDGTSVIGRSAEFALVDADGNTAFLEKALKFIEDYGVKVEGILRQSADVEEVKRRVRDYEKGKNEFSPEEDAHVIGDCIKCILREMPSSPVPAPCCTALVRAYRTDKTRRLDAMNRVICEVFPESNRQLLQRILKMMQIVGSHRAVNRMSASALAACMAPLLLRPLLLGECEIDSDFSMAGDGSFQLLQAAAAANHAQAIVIIMLEEYDQIFDDIEDGSYSSDAYTESDVDKEYSTDNDIPEDDGSYGSGEDDVEEDLNDNTERSSGSRIRNTDDQVNNNIPGPACDDNKVAQPPVKTLRTEHGMPSEDSNQISSLPKVDDTSQLESNLPSQSKQELCESKRSIDHIQKPNAHSSSSRAELMEKTSKRNSWGRTSARKDLSTEEADCRNDDDEARIVKLENNKSHLQSKITEEVRENTVLQASLERRKGALHERRVALEKEVENLRDQLQKERNLRASLESGLMNMRRGHVSFPSTIDSKTKADLEEVAAAEADIMNLKQKVSDLRGQLNNQAQLSSTSLCESCNKRLQNADKLVEGEQNAALSPEISSSVKAPSTVMSNSVPDMFWATNQMVQKMLISKDGQDGSLATRWNFAQNRVQGSNTYSSTKTEESGVAASSALVKLTNRLNFLKERRAQLASEMQNLDMGRPQAQGSTATAPPKRDSS